MTHIDDEAIAALTAHYSRVLPSTAEGNTIGHLDLSLPGSAFYQMITLRRIALDLG